MRAALSKAEIQEAVSARFGPAFQPQEKRTVETLSTGIPQIDSSIGGGLPRGAITEIYGQASSGRTSFMLSTLAHATRHEEVCALVDTSKVFDPLSAARAEINFDRLLWIGCANNLEHAFKATDLLLQAGGFGIVVLDLGDVPAKSAKRIISSWWYRFRRTLEATPTVLVVIAEETCVGSRAALGLELIKQTEVWSSNREESKVLPVFPRLSVATPERHQGNRDALPHSNLLQGLSFQIECRRPLYLKDRNRPSR